MAERRPLAIDEALPAASFSFKVLDLVFKDERDLPGLMRFKLEGLLPRGLEGLQCYFRRVGRSRRVLVTLVKEPVPDGFAPSKTALPFDLRIPERDARTIQWVSRNADFIVRYEGGALASVDIRDNGDEPQPSPGDGILLPERRDAVERGHCIQEAVGRDDLVRKIASAVLVIALAAQLVIAGIHGISTREARLRALEDQIALLSNYGGGSGASSASAPDVGLQSRAEAVQKSVSQGWKFGFYLTKWSLKGSRLRLEGWGPDALVLLASLRSDPALAKLDLVSRASEKGYETFAFEGELRHD